VESVNSVGGVEGVKAEDRWEVRYESLFGVEREEIVRELNRSGDYDTAQRLAGCRKSYHVHQCGACGKIEVSGSRCNSRICPECGKKRLDKLIAQNVDFLSCLPSNPRGKKRANLLTLTLKNVLDRDYGRAHYERLAQWFREFLKHPRIRGHIRGGLYAIETKRPRVGYFYFNQDGSSHELDPNRDWNLHIHSLVDSDYIPVRVISRIWRKITGDSYIVDVRAIRASVPALYECLKYAVKPPNLGDAESYVRFLRVTKSLRLFNTFGTFRGHLKLGKKGKRKCPACGFPMSYQFDVDSKEALRYKQYLENGPPIDIFGRKIGEMDFPHTLEKTGGMIWQT